MASQLIDHATRLAKDPDLQIAWPNANHDHYKTSLQEICYDLCDLHPSIYEQASKLDLHSFSTSRVSWHDMTRLFAWDGLLLSVNGGKGRDFDQKTVEEWRESLKETAVHLVHCQKVLSRLKDRLSLERGLRKRRAPTAGLPLTRSETSDIEGI